MDLRFELALIRNCSMTGGVVGLCAGALSGSFTQAAGFAAGTAAWVYVAAKGRQFAAEPAPAPKGNG